MAASGRNSAPVAACGILVALGAPNSYNFIYSRFPFNGWIGAFTSEPRAAVISRQRMFCWSEGDFATGIWGLRCRSLIEIRYLDALLESATYSFCAALRAIRAVRPIDHCTLLHAGPQKVLGVVASGGLLYRPPRAHRACSACAAFSRSSARCVSPWRLAFSA